MGRKLALLFLFPLFLHSLFAAHFIVGVVEDAGDGASPNGLTVTLWNIINGTSINLTDVVGPTGNSGADDTYLIDCELSPLHCQVGDTLSLQIFSSIANPYFTPIEVNVTVTGAGFDVASNLSLNSPPNISNISVDDFLLSPADEIDLLAGSFQEVNCSVVVQDFEEDTPPNISARFYSLSRSTPFGSDDNNEHYTNTSCFRNESYGDATQTFFSCSFNIAYYASPGPWQCLVNLTYESSQINASDATSINSLLSLGTSDYLDYGLLFSEEVSSEATLNITNYGNVFSNLSLTSYARFEGDGYTMNCSFGGNISVEHHKFNVSASTSGPLNLTDTSGVYVNLSSTTLVAPLGISSREDDIVEDTLLSTYWRIYVPENATGTCAGTLILGAVQEEERYV